ncbi:MAG: TlpA family protein disulfide reductase [Ornithinimicrobium sp.]|uniref:TlpA family protein disulfide reductase n=1 Tax=Ornithinimicrobium sp. TaxID=1977084 RepID=UPI003D9BBBD5
MRTAARRGSGPASALSVVGRTAALATLLAVAGCSDNTVEAQAQAGQEKGYISGDGAVQVVTPEQREQSLELDGTTLEGDPWSAQDQRGEVLVVNVWGSWCGPCQAEAADLEQVYSDYAQAGEPVDFIGVNDRDSDYAALAFQEAKGVSYPSLVDDGGRTLLDLRGLAQARPTTLVLDPQGRVAARVAGQVDASTLNALIEDVLSES